jgi:peptide/bleomycin uptake transporter
LYFSFFTTKKHIFKAYGGLIVLILLLVYEVSLSVQFNEWYGQFYNILQKATEYSVDVFWDKITEFTFIAFQLIFAISIASYLAKFYAFWWREAITFTYMPLFKQSKYNVEGASQRIQEDTFRFARIVESLGLQITRAIMTLIAFIPILYTLSNDIILPYLKDIEGSLVYVAIAVSIGGIMISWFVGIKLPGLEYNNQKVEASFRKELVYAEDDRDRYADPQTIFELFTGLKINYKKLFLHYTYFDLWLNSYNQLMVIVPYLLMAPSLFSGTIMLGVLTQTGNAFGKVQQSFSVITDNWTTVTELRSIHKRLKEFEYKLQGKTYP